MHADYAMPSPNATGVRSVAHSGERAAVVQRMACDIGVPFHLIEQLQRGLEIIVLNQVGDFLEIRFFRSPG